MITAINDDLFTPEIIADPYACFHRLREENSAHDHLVRDALQQAAASTADD
jgi:hypothetical protein